MRGRQWFSLLLRFCLIRCKLSNRGVRLKGCTPFLISKRTPGKKGIFILTVEEGECTAGMAINLEENHRTVLKCLGPAYDIIVFWKIILKKLSDEPEDVCALLGLVPTKKRKIRMGGLLAAVPEGIRS